MRVSYAVRHRDYPLVINTEDPAKSPIVLGPFTMITDRAVTDRVTTAPPPCPDLRGSMDKVYVTLSSLE